VKANNICGSGGGFEAEQNIKGKFMEEPVTYPAFITKIKLPEQVNCPLMILF
jgi:hypothetical protein